MAMTIPSALRSVLSLLRGATLRLQVARFKVANHLSRKSVVCPTGPVVSMATYGERTKMAFLAIESIASGALRPCRLLLWLDDPRQMAELPVQLRRLQKRGLEVKLSDRNYGPHKKYFPYVMNRRKANLAGANGPLVTADDDVLYPTNWLAEFSSAHSREPDLVQCYRARIIAVVAGELTPYATWPLCRSSEASFRIFAVGVSGVLYPSRLLDLLCIAGAAFETTCPRADDLWLHANAIRNGFRIRQLTKDPVHFPILPGTQQGGLQQHNLQNGGNDAQARQTYTAEDIAILYSATAVAS